MGITRRMEAQKLRMTTQITDIQPQASSTKTASVATYADAVTYILTHLNTLVSFYADEILVQWSVAKLLLTKKWWEGTPTTMLLHHHPLTPQGKKLGYEIERNGKLTLICMNPVQQEIPRGCIYTLPSNHPLWDRWWIIWHDNARNQSRDVTPSEEGAEKGGAEGKAGIGVCKRVLYIQGRHTWSKFEWVTNVICH